MNAYMISEQTTEPHDGYGSGDMEAEGDLVA